MCTAALHTTRGRSRGFIISKVAVLVPEIISSARRGSHPDRPCSYLPDVIDRVIRAAAGRCADHILCRSHSIRGRNPRRAQAVAQLVCLST